MPSVSEFFGITVALTYADHAPPHVHGVHGGDEALVGIDPLRLLRGELAPRAAGLVTEWLLRNRDALMDGWLRARLGLPLERIPPLD
jgi:hypothetical protein